MAHTSDTRTDYLNSKQRAALKALGGHGLTMNALVRRGLVTHHQTVWYGQFGGKNIRYWYLHTDAGRTALEGC